jgi:hypothetical protein
VVSAPSGWGLTPRQRIEPECARRGEIALASVTSALRDGHWRVREMGCMVVARHQVGDALPGVAGLRDDPVARVRKAAARAVVLLTEAGA